MTSPRGLVALVVALLAASTGRVPFLSPPVRAVLSFVLPGGSGGGAGAGSMFSSNDNAAGDGDDNADGFGSLRASRVLSIAMRNATSDYDEVRRSMIDRKNRRRVSGRGSNRGGGGDSRRRLWKKQLEQDGGPAADNRELIFSLPLPLYPPLQQLASIVSEWFRSPEHGAEDEAAFIEFLKVKAKR
jgi:hypothetical protein